MTKGQAGFWERHCPLPAVICSGSAFPLALRVSEDSYITCERKHTLSNLEILVNFLVSCFLDFIFFPGLWNGTDVGSILRNIETQAVVC